MRNLTLFVIFAIAVQIHCRSRRSSQMTFTNELVDQGSDCTNYDGRAGTCKAANNCEVILKLLKDKQITPKEMVHCGGFEGTFPIICCPSPIVKLSQNDLRINKVGEKSDKFCDEISNLKPKLFLDEHVAGGENSEVGEFPHLVAIGYKDLDMNVDYKCGGSLISPNFVLTAAHCLDGKKDSSAKTVKIGRTSLIEDEKDKNPSLDINIKNITIHPGYKRPKFYNDIALIELESEVDYSASAHYIKPACLYREGIQYTPAPNTLGIAGWGLDENKTRHEWLQKGLVKELTKDQCPTAVADTQKNRLPQGFIDSQLCAIGHKDGKTVDSCNGDSGGPLHEMSYIGTNKVFFIKGIVSFGSTSCNDKDVAGVYTKVSEYVEWIENIVWP